MVLIRVPFPKEPAKRQAILDRAVDKFGSFGSFEGTTEAGSFQGSTLIGSIAGTYSSPAGSEEIEIILTKKPWLLSTGQIESELRRYIKKSEAV